MYVQIAPAVISIASEIWQTTVVIHNRLKHWMRKLKLLTIGGKMIAMKDWRIPTYNHITFSDEDRPDGSLQLAWRFYSVHKVAVQYTLYQLSSQYKKWKRKQL